MAHNPAFHRTELLIGAGALERLAAARVILFGVGGVGSWCAEALVRSGVGHLTIVDSDVVCITNVNRQVQAMPDTVGKAKVTELADRLQRIAPTADIVALQLAYGEATRDRFDIPAYDYVLDAIDSLSQKVDLLCTAMGTGRVLFSAMGAACKLDPTRVRVASIWETRECPLAREVRKRLRRRGTTGGFLCVYSEENLPSAGGGSACGSARCFCPRRPVAEGEEPTEDWCSKKAQINGSMLPVTGTFGFVLAGLVVQDIVTRAAAP